MRVQDIYFTVDRVGSHTHEQRRCLSLITFVCASRCEPTFTVVVVASPSHEIASLWSKTNYTYTSRITAIQASQERLSLSRTLPPPASWS